MFDFSEVKNYDPELAEAMENELTRHNIRDTILFYINI